MRALRVLLVLDAAVLLVLGVLLIGLPEQVAQAFRFEDLPQGVYFIIGLWGCVLATTGIGYAVAAHDPLRHVVWVQVGIARGALECVIGVIYMARGVVEFQQAGLGIVVGAIVAVGYAALYPREPRPAPGEPTASPSQPEGATP